jgi:hypothetical protein
MEVELQFVYKGDGPLVVPVRLADLDLDQSTAGFLRDTYYDTETLDLRRAGCSLRVRQSELTPKPRLTFKGPSRKRSGVKRRQEIEVDIESVPAGAGEMRAVLVALELEQTIQQAAGLGGPVAPHPIGELRSRRSHHRYVHGLHRLDLTWDELEFPTGPPQVRVEVEACSEPAERLLRQAAEELLELLGSARLTAPERGKTRELCERLYPELLAA